MISSAVVIPEQTPPPATETISSPSLKRRQPSFSPEINKRPRLDTHTTNGSISLDYGSQASPTLPSSAASPPRRKSSALTGTEEKKRGQRLFGGLLGTLSQTSSKPGSAQRKREDIEKRQIERAKAQNEEREEERRRRREELAETRREEQKQWDEESQRIRWANMRATAGFLRTETEPRLYYKPWEIRETESSTIERQKEEVEDEIRREIEKFDGKDPALSDEPPRPDMEKENGDSNGTSSNVNGDLTEIQAATNGDHKDETSGTDRKMDEVEDPPPPEEKPKQDEHEHNGEELVQGQEDDVIY